MDITNCIIILPIGLILLVYGLIIIIAANHKSNIIKLAIVPPILSDNKIIISAKIDLIIMTII